MKIRLVLPSPDPDVLEMKESIVSVKRIPVRGEMIALKDTDGHERLFEVTQVIHVLYSDRDYDAEVQTIQVVPSEDFTPSPQRRGAPLPGIEPTI